jgi:uncharacterized protein (TIGR00299 family) protein
MRIAYFDCCYGAAGDMLLASLVEAGRTLTPDFEQKLLKEIAKIKLPPDSYRITVEKTSRCSLACTKFNIECFEQKEERHLSEILEIIDSSAIESNAKALAKQIFQNLAKAEAKVHGTSLEAVHFHEVGGIDAIIDITGFAIAYTMLGIEKSIVSRLPVGSGFAKTRHGLFPVPPPAVLYLLTESQVPIADSAFQHECLTPTGAAILTTIAHAYGALPAVSKITATGYGAGSFNPKDFPNVVRAIVGIADNALSGSANQFDKEFIAVLEANIDDCSPQIIAHALDTITKAGALDVFVCPVQMKKGRSGHLLTVLCKPEDKSTLEGLIIAETTTIGVRSYLNERAVLQRSFKEVTLSKGDSVRLKLAKDTYGKVMNVQAEFEDCAEYARKHDLPVKQVLAEALSKNEDT